MTKFTPWTLALPGRTKPGFRPRPARSASSSRSLIPDLSRFISIEDPPSVLRQKIALVRIVDESDLVIIIGPAPKIAAARSSISAKMLRLTETCDWADVFAARRNAQYKFQSAVPLGSFRQQIGYLRYL